MAKLFSSILFSFFLLFQTISIAEEDPTPTEINTEKPATKANVAQEEQELKKELSDAQKEALAAEEAELREAGMDEEPLDE